MRSLLLVLWVLTSSCMGEIKVIKNRMMMKNKKVEMMEIPVVQPSPVTARETVATNSWQDKIASLVPGEHDAKALGLYAGTSILALAVLFALYLFFGTSSSSKSSNRAITSDNDRKRKVLPIRGSRHRAPLDVVVVGCGLPKKGMGWYHLTQLLEMTNVNVIAVVEPFFMNPTLCSQIPPSFATLKESLERQGISVVQSVQDLWSFSSKPTLCLIAGRTADNPTLFRQCVDKQAHVIYLEKPGAPSVQELQEMNDLANRHNIPVYLGYNKNVTSYIRQAVTLARQTPNSKLVLAHNNSYTREDLPEVFVRNAEGMLKNMAVHELALLVTYFDITVDTIRSLTVNTSKLFSEKLQIPLPSTEGGEEKSITDFSRIGFKITDVNGETISIFADRCGGNVSFAMVQDEQGRELAKFEFPDAEQMIQLEEQVRADPEMMPYFFVQGADYQELKRRVIEATLNKTVAEGVATIQVGVEALKLAEYANSHLGKALAPTILNDI